jgi:hypothetical protein
LLCLRWKNMKSCLSWSKNFECACVSPENFFDPPPLPLPRGQHFREKFVRLGQNPRKCWSWIWRPPPPPPMLMASRRPCDLWMVQTRVHILRTFVTRLLIRMHQKKCNTGRDSTMRRDFSVFES